MSSVQSRLCTSAAKLLTESARHKIQSTDLVPVATRADGAALYQSTVNGVQIEVIKVGNNVTAGYPVGSRGFQTKTNFLTGKN